MRTPYRLATRRPDRADAGGRSRVLGEVVVVIVSGGYNWSKATSASAGGGMTALVAAAKKEGTLNVIALPPTWANYGNIIKDFTSKYGIKVNSAQPGRQQPGRDQRGQAEEGHRRGARRARRRQCRRRWPTPACSRPYQVEHLGGIPASQKEPTGPGTQDYGGYMSVGYNSAKFGTITSLSQLLGPKFKNAVALNGNPTAGQRRAERRHDGRTWPRAARAGSIAKGVDFFHKLKQAGNFVAVSGHPGAPIKAGTTPVVFNWDYLNTAQRTSGSAELEGVRPAERRAGRLLLPGDQQGRAAPGGGPAVGGVPVLPGHAAAGRTCGCRAAPGRSSRPP